MSSMKHNNDRQTHYIYRLLRDADASPDKCGKIGCTQQIYSRMKQHFRGEKLEGREYEILCVLENSTRLEAETKEFELQEQFNVVDGYNNNLGENNGNYGKRMSELNREKMRHEQAKWNRARKWFNDGSINKFCVPGEEPGGFVRGRLMKRNNDGTFHKKSDN